MRMFTDYKKINISYLNVINSIIIFIFYILYFTKTADTGFDLTDEGFYITSIDHVSDWGFTFSPFGLLFSYIYEFLNFNIGYLRIFSFIVLFFYQVILFTTINPHSQKEMYLIKIELSRRQL